MDIDELIANLKIERETRIEDFMTKLAEINDTIRFAGTRVTPNALLKKVFRILFTCPDIIPYITSQHSAFKKFIRENGPNAEYEDVTIDTIIGLLLDSEVEILRPRKSTVDQDPTDAKYC